MVKRILIYTNHFYPEQFKINEIVDWLSEKNYEIRVITGLPNYPKGRIFKGYFFNNKNYNFGIRSSEIKLSDSGEEFEIELAEISGSETLLHLKRGNSKIIALIEEVMNFKIHEKVKINFNANKFYAFGEDEKLVSSPYGGTNG